MRHRQAARELIEYGLVRGDRVPAFTGAQALGCAPVYNAFHSDTPDRVLPVKPDTIARSIAIGNPSDGVYVNRIARETGGVVEAVTEEEIVDAMRLLARTEGIFTETAGASRSACCPSWRARVGGKVTRWWSRTSPGTA